MKLLYKSLLLLTLSCGATIIFNIQEASAIDWSGVEICVTGGPVKTGYSKEWNPWEGHNGIWTWSFPVYIRGGFCGNDPQNSRCQVEMSGRSIWDYTGNDMWNTDAWYETGAVTGGSFDCSGESEHHNSPITVCYEPWAINDLGDDRYYMKINHQSSYAQILHGYVKIKDGDEMEGRATAGPKDTGYTQNNMTTTVYNINDCPTTGCTTNLGLYLKWKTISVNEPAQYKTRILRDGAWTVWKWKVDTASKPNDSNELKILEGEEKLTPGKSVCYQLEFTKYTDFGEPIYITSCAVAAKTFETTMNISVKNETIEKYNQDGLTEVYAKPGDKVTFTTNYTPDPQYAYSFRYKDPKIINFTCQDAEDVKENQIIHTGTLGSSYGAKLGNCNSPGPWRNAFSIQKDTKTDFSSPNNVIENPSYNVGNTTKRTTNNSFSINAANVGSSVNERATTNLNSNTKTTPKKVEFSFGNEESLPENVYYIYSAAYNKALDVQNGDYFTGRLWLYPPNQTDAQKWIIQRTESDSYTITQATSGKALDVTGAGSSNGTIAQIYRQNNESCAQKWNIQKNDDDTYTLSSVCGASSASGKVLDADASTEGGYIMIYDSHGGANQRWKIEPASENNTIDIDTSPTNSNTASVKVPYNFINSTCIYDNKHTENNDENGCLKPGTNGTFSAGEGDSVGFKIFVNPRENKLVGSSYATPVRNARWKLEMRYNTDSYQTVLESDNTRPLNLNDGANYKSTGTKQDISKNNKIDIPDAPAGTRICFRSAIYPKDSGHDGNISLSSFAYNYNPANPNSWAYSDEACFTIAKKPSIQVWGGNIYSSGAIKTNTAINTNTAVKTNLAGIKEWTVGTSSDGDNTKYVFGSWGELGVISSGTVTGFSSGASLGYTSNDNGALTANPGGSNKDSVCERSPLTFNNVCNGATVGSLGKNNSSGANFVRNIEVDRKSIIDKFIRGGDVNVNGTVQLNSNIGENNVAYYYGGNKALIIPGTNINRGTIQVVHSKENITIQGNLLYNDNNYSSFNDMPKLVIYSEGDVNITCGVTQIDALIIAKKAVNTCSDSTDINDEKHSTQLTINGSIIAGSLEPKRTYGAATGINSIVPAEIINFDPSLYLWGGEQSQTNNDVNANMDITYQKELAPRY